MPTDPYQYPPDLFELLVETVPLLCRSKQSVLDFFVGAGVDTRYIRDLQQTVITDRDAINKYDIVRTVLTRINAQGDQTLRARREVLKRVTEFEDFSTCWPSDQLKARGLVAQIRSVINVKDSFTRMDQERERERQHKQAQYRSELEAKQKRDAEMDKVKAELYALFAFTDTWKRGKALEGVLNRLFKIYGIGVREAFHVIGDESQGIVEQIDGAVELDGRLYLVEMKWWQESIGVGDVSQHQVRVFGRGEAGGIFISNSRYSDPAIASCKDFLAHRIFILCELQEIVLLLEKSNDLSDLLRQKVQAAILDKKAFFKPYV